MEVWKIIFLSKWVICRSHDMTSFPFRFAESPGLPDQMYHTCPKTGWDRNTSRYPQQSDVQKSHVTKNDGIEGPK